MPKQIIIVPPSSTPTTVEITDTTTVVVTQSGGTPIPPPPVNQPPIVTITAPTSHTIPGDLTLIANASDSDGSIVSYLWTKTSGPAATITNDKASSTTVTGLVVGSYVFRVEVTDDKGARVSTSTPPIAVKAIVQPPLTNVALNKPATSSGNETLTFTANLAVDGNSTTRWSSPFTDPQWIYVDLGNPHTIERVKITWEAAYGRNYLIQTSNNASAWTTIKTITNNTTLVNDHIGLVGSGRYVRIYGTARGTAFGYSIYELEIYGTSDGTTPLPPPPPPPTTGSEIFRITPGGYDYLDAGVWKAMTKSSIGNITTGGIIRGQIFSNTGTGNSGRCVQINTSNVTLENCIIGEGNGVGLYISPGVNNITIKNCLFHNTALAAYVNRTTGNVKFIDNWSLNQEWDWLNPSIGFRNGQFIFFEAAGGAGNEVVDNRIENNFGESFNEDQINTYASSNIRVEGNKTRGGQGSFTGGGIIAGDNGSNNIDILNNDLIDPGWYGIQVYGGNDIVVRGNRIWSPSALPWNSVGFLVYNGSGTCTNVVMDGTNSAYYRRRPQFGNIYNLEIGSGCSGSIGGVVNDPDLLAKMNFPSHLINCVSVDDYWKLRSMKWRQQAIINSHSNCSNCPDVNPRRPTANAGTNQTITTASTTLDGRTSTTSTGGNGAPTLSGWKWEQASGPNVATIAAPTLPTTTVSGLVNGVYTFRLVVEQNNNQYNLKTYHAAWVAVIKQ